MALAGNDTIENGDERVYNSSIISGANVTIDGGTGNDTINFATVDGYSSRFNTIQYASGDGNDVIENFDSTNTLNIPKGKISKTSVSGDDFIVYVGEGTMTFKNFVGSSLDVKLADGTTTTLKAEAPFWKIKGTTATYGTSTQIYAKITGLKKSTTFKNISVKGDSITLSKAALGTSKVKLTGDYKLALASDVKKS